MPAPPGITLKGRSSTRQHAVPAFDDLDGKVFEIKTSRRLLSAQAVACPLRGQGAPPCSSPHLICWPATRSQRAFKSKKIRYLSLPSEFSKGPLPIDRFSSKCQEERLRSPGLYEKRWRGHLLCYNNNVIGITTLLPTRDSRDSVGFITALLGTATGKVACPSDSASLP
jgi:hypothetical protein